MAKKPWALTPEGIAETEKKHREARAMAEADGMAMFALIGSGYYDDLAAKNAEREAKGSKAKRRPRKR
ncbi:MAG: hypothetical protein PHC53_05260 [Patescibacteria group bacterium]|nr:hypothetical protein [Patescibacteria group bacterium]